MSANKAYTRFQATHKRGLDAVKRSVTLWKIVICEVGTDYDTMNDPTVSQYNKKSSISDMGRSGIVICVAAFDDYFTNRFTECIVPILKNEGVSKKLEEFLIDAGIDVSTALKLLRADRPYRTIRNIIGSYLSKKVTQDIDKIDKLFKSISIDSLSKAVIKRTHRKNIIKSIEPIILRRHQIVHAGDLNNYGKVRGLNYKDSIKRINDLKIYVEAAESIIVDRLKKRNR